MLRACFTGTWISTIPVRLFGQDRQLQSRCLCRRPVGWRRAADWPRLRRCVIRRAATPSKSPACRWRATSPSSMLGYPIPPFPPGSDVAYEIGRLERGDVPARRFQAHRPDRGNLSGVAPAFRDSVQEPALPLVEFCSIRDIYRVAFRDTFRVIFPRSFCRPAASGFAGSVGFPGARQRNAIHQIVPPVCCWAFDQAEKEGSDDRRGNDKA